MSCFISVRMFFVVVVVFFCSKSFFLFTRSFLNNSFIGWRAGFVLRKWSDLDAKTSCRSACYLPSVWSLSNTASRSFSDLTLQRACLRPGGDQGSDCFVLMASSLWLHIQEQKSFFWWSDEHQITVCTESYLYQIGVHCVDWSTEALEGKLQGSAWLEPKSQQHCY